ncbi:MAG TPA: glycosyltransferase [Chthoniobacterales bacterium]|jgi:processive 1,2-diacylglycerol beta-glucosyltransferase
MKKRVLIMSTSAGSGHVRAAQALERSFAAHPNTAEVIHEDALKYTNKLFSDFYSKFYATLVESAPNFLGWWYKQSDEPWKTDSMRLALDRLNTGPLVKFIEDFQPDITVCTHFMPAGIISHLITEKKLSTHLSIVVTDLDFHAMWLSRAFHRYFVALDETRAHLDLLGLPNDRITVSGIPIDPAFSGSYDRAALRTELGLSPSLPTLLISAGALGKGPAEDIVSGLFTLRNRTQTIVICGKNEELKEKIEALTEGHEGFAILGYTDRMHHWMAAADLFIGKPGGLTTSEALAARLPMVIVSPIPGQEERNSDHLLEEGIAIKANDLITLPYKIDRLLDDPARLQAMRENTTRLFHPRAADTIVETLMHDEPEHIVIEPDPEEKGVVVAQVA